MNSSTPQTSADDAKSMNDLFELAEKLTIQLNEKDKELQKSQQENEKLLANLDLEKARAIRVDEMEMKMVNAHKTIGALQMTFWKSFPSPHLYYHIKAPSGNGGYSNIYVDDSGFLCSSVSGHPPSSMRERLKEHFKFEKDSDGTFSIYSSFMDEYLQSRIFTTQASSIMLSATKTKFVLIFHQQHSSQPGISVDIFSLANGCFLSPEVDLHNRILATSPVQPAKKFLILKC